MFGFHGNAEQVTATAVLPSRKRRLLSLVAIAGSLVLASATSPANAQQGGFSIQQLGDTLTSYGKNTVANNGQTYYTVACGQQGQWKSNIIISLSPNGKFIWMTLEPSQMSGGAPASALASILKKNTDIGPMFFSLNGNALRLSYPIPNDDMSAGKIKAYMEALVDTAVSTRPLWESGKHGTN
jgi:hypothetical protein